MKRAREKWNSTAGVSIVFALLGLLIASAVSLTIVSAALNNIERVDEQQAAQRDMLAVTSAASLLREKLAGQEVTIVQIFEPNHTTERMEARRIESTGDELAEALAVAMLDSGSLAGDMTLTAGEGLNMTVHVQFTGTRLEMGFTPQGETLPASTRLIFDGAAPQMLSDLPHYQWVWDASTETGEWVLDYWTRTTKIAFAAERIYASQE